MSFSWSETLGTICPMLATAIGTCVGGPLGPLAGMAVKTLCDKFGLTATPENAQAIATKIQDGTLTDSEREKLQEAELEHSEAMQKFANDAAQFNAQNQLATYQVEASDRDSARKRQESIKDWTPTVGFYGITLGFFGLLIGSLFHQIPEANKAIVYSMIGSLGTAWIGVVSYFYGASHSAKDAMSMIYNSTPTDIKK